MRKQLGGRARTRAQVIDVLASRFEVDDSGCWLWTGRLTNAGYAAFTWKPGPAERIHRCGHRVIWRALGMPVPDELVVDHLCRVRHCINPDHMEWVTQRENVMRSPIALGAINSSKTHCAVSLSDELRRLSDDERLLWEVARQAIEDELVEWRDNGLSMLTRNNGLVIKYADGTPSHAIRFGPETAVRIGLRAIADHLEADAVVPQQRQGGTS